MQPKDLKKLAYLQSSELNYGGRIRRGHNRLQFIWRVSYSHLLHLPKWLLPSPFSFTGFENLMKWVRKRDRDWDAKIEKTEDQKERVVKHGPWMIPNTLNEQKSYKRYKEDRMAGGRQRWRELVPPNSRYEHGHMNQCYLVFSMSPNVYPLHVPITELPFSR